MKHLTTILLLSFALNTPWLRAQEVISSGGGHANGTGIALSWTIGELVTETFTNGSNILTQGFHQSRLSSTAIDDIPFPGLSLAVYPNPFTCVFNIKVDQGDFSQLEYSLLSINGKVLLNKKMTRDLTQIEMQTFATGNYLLRINRRTGEPVKTYKVVKQ
jgi:hypothetical protein